MKKVRAWMGILLASVLTVGSISLTGTSVGAEEKGEVLEGTLELYQEGSCAELMSAYIPAQEADGMLKKYRSFSGVEQVLYNGLLNAQEEIDISVYNLTSDQLRTHLSNVVNLAPDLFYVAGQYTYSYDRLTMRVESVLPKYSVSGSELQQQKNFYNNSMTTLLSGVKSSWSDLEKILYVHDYLVQNYEYDTSSLSSAIYDAYNFFKEKKGVCQAYTLVFAGAMEKLGIANTVATSDAMNHIWNVVSLNGKWYHVDATWDDPLMEGGDRFSLVSHDNLLLSDTQIASEGHYNWNCIYTCSDDTFKDFIWTDVESPFQYLSGKWYFAQYLPIDGTSEDTSWICECTFADNNKYVNPAMLFNIGVWKENVNQSGYWTTAYSGLDVLGDRIYFNTADGIYSFKSGGSPTLEFKPAITGSIYGMRIDGTTLSYVTAMAPDGKGARIDTKQVSSYHDPDVEVTVYGDVDASGRIDLKDAQIALKTALKIINPNSNVRTFMDVTGDGQISLKDAQVILKYALKIIKTFPRDEK